MVKRRSKVTETLTAEWIGEQLHKHRIQQKELAKALDIAPSGVTRLLAGERALRSREVPVVISFFSRYLVDVPKIYDPGVVVQRKTGGTRHAHAELPNRRVDHAPVPIFARLVHSTKAAWTADFREPPAPLRAARGVFGFYVNEDDDFAPTLLAGEVAYVHPGRPALEGARVVVEMSDQSVAVGLLHLDKDGRHLITGRGSLTLKASDKVQLIAAIEAL